MAQALFYLPYLPPIDWMRLWVQHGERWLEREENFVKSSYRNRCEIVAANGRQTLSIPIQGGRDHHQLYKDVRIAPTDWQRQHWQSIRSAYGSAPFYEHYADRFQIFYEKPYEFLYDFNLEVLQGVLKCLRLETQDIASLQTRIYEKTPLDKIDLRDGAVTRVPARGTPTTYPQVFADRHGFQPNLSIIDLIFNEGPQALRYLQQ